MRSTPYTRSPHNSRLIASVPNRLELPHRWDNASQSRLQFANRLKTPFSGRTIRDSEANGCKQVGMDMLVFG
jgi:hypothetical protein